MPLFVLQEIIDMVLMSLIVGYLFMGFIPRPREENYDPLKAYAHPDRGHFLFAIQAVAPAIILHELAHKFVALSFGLEAVFQAAYFFLGVGLLLKLLNFGFIFFVPAYVSITGNATALQFSMTALAGPLTNGLLWLVAAGLLRSKKVKKSWAQFLALTARINMFLFIFNLLPIPGFDGWQVYRGLFAAFF